jgi:hypothetical protein
MTIALKAKRFGTEAGFRYLAWLWPRFMYLEVLYAPTRSHQQLS